MALTNMADVHSKVVRIKPSTLFGNCCNHITTIHPCGFNNIIKLLAVACPSYGLTSEPIMITLRSEGEEVGAHLRTSKFITV